MSDGNSPDIHDEPVQKGVSPKGDKAEAKLEEAATTRNKIFNILDSLKNADDDDDEKKMAMARNGIFDILNDQDVWQDSSGKEGQQKVACFFELLQKYPSLAEELYPLGKFCNDPNRVHTSCEVMLRPLEQLILLQAPLPWIKKFCTEHPRSVVQRGSSTGLPPHVNMGLPLHLACERYSWTTKYSHHLILYLISTFPEAISIEADDGYLPIHKLLLHYSGDNNDRENISHLQEIIEVLVRAHPESIIKRVRFPWEAVSLVLCDRFDIRILECILRHVPNNVRRFNFSDIRAWDMNPAQCQCICQILFPRMESIDFSNSANGEELCRAFFENVQNFAMLRNLDLRIPLHVVVGNMDTYAVGNMDTYALIKEGFRHLTNLKSLILSLYGECAQWERCQSFDMSEPLSLLLEGNNQLRTLIVKDCYRVIIQPDSILQPIIDNPDSSIQTLDIRCFPRNADITEILARLISVNKTNLEHLVLKHITFEPQPIFEALARNTHLKSLGLPNIMVSSSSANQEDTNDIVDDNDNDTGVFTSLSRTLQHYNATLEHVNWIDASFYDLEDLEYERIRHYTLLNRFGRARARSETCTCLDLIEMLDVVFRDDNLNRHKKMAILSVSYGLLREAPLRWCRTDR